MFLIHSVALLLWTLFLIIFYIKGAKHHSENFNVRYFLGLLTITFPLITWLLFVLWGK